MPSLPGADGRPSGKRTVNTVFGTRVAVLVGDYLFAQSSNNLANLDNLEVIKLISKVIADFANGEVSQMGNLFNADTTLETYLDKSFYKTATLIAASCRSEAVFSGADEALKADMYAYGRHLGLAFQVVDDILDVTATSEQLGKTAGKDVAVNKATYPSLLGLEESRRIADQLIAQAKEELAGFDKKRASPLIGLADYIASRKS